MIRSEKCAWHAAAGCAQCSVGSIDAEGIRYGFAISASKASTKPMASAIVIVQSATERHGCGRRRTGIELKLDEGELLVIVEPRDADPDEAKRSRPLAEGAVEQATGEGADRLRVVDPGPQ